MYIAQFLFQCSTSCGKGTQYRVVICILSNGDYGKPADCNLGNMPEARRSCELVSCPIMVAEMEKTTTTSPLISNRVEPVQKETYWRTGPWTEVSLVCLLLLTF